MKYVALILFLPGLVFAQGGHLVKISSQEKFLYSHCDPQLLNPHLGGDIYFVRCPGQELDISWKLAETNDPENRDQWALPSMNVEALWQRGTVGDASMVVAIIDSGVNVGHEDFSPQTFTNEKEIPGNNLDDDHNGYVDDVYGWNSVDNNNQVNDPFDHGTAIAGIMGARTNNQLGMAGLNWKIKIVPVKFIGDDGGGTTASAIRALDYAVARNARIINLSWGGYTEAPLLKEVMQRCQDNGILFVAASGNESNDNDVQPFYPAGFDLQNIISVGAIDFRGGLASFSNYGKKSVHISAPGESVLSTVGMTRYGFKTGTSYAAPQISGAAALIWAKNPLWTYKEVKEFLLTHCHTKEELKDKIQCGGAFSF